MKHGKGKYTWNDGSMYNGYWYENKINGTGIYTWPDGRRYEGEWKEHQRHGQGTYYYAETGLINIYLTLFQCIFYL